MLALVLRLGAAADAPATPADTDSDHRLARNGVVVQFSAQPVEKPGAGVMEGDIADVRFKISDEASGQPMRGVVPGAWMDMAFHIQGQAGSDQKSCKDKVALYLKGAVGMRPMLDLNSYFVVLMNNDASISVVDPLVTMAGVTSTFATTLLKRPGADWARHDNSRRLFVSMPKAGEVAVIETDNFKVTGNVAAGKDPMRVVLQPDQRYLWVGNNAAEAKDSGATAIDTASLKPAGFIATGAGHHEFAFTADSRYAFVSNRNDGTVSVIDVARRTKVKDIRTGTMPLALDYSALSRRLYVADGKEGVVTVIDTEKLAVASRVAAKPGLGPLKVTPDGRFALVVNTAENRVHVLDTASDTLVQEVPIKAQPYQITFSKTFAFVRALGSERVSMINLSTLGKGKTATVQSFAAGETAPNLAGNLVIADSVAAAANEGTVFVVNPADGTTYYYMEGMNSPSSNYRVYGSNPRAVTVVDRSLKEVEPGVYAGRVRIPVSGKYDVAFMLDSPKLLHCFAMDAKANPSIARTTDPLLVEFDERSRHVTAGGALALRFKLLDPATRQVKAGIKDARVMYFLAPGRGRSEAPVKEVGKGVYEVQMQLEQPGAYYVYVGVPSMELAYGKLPFFTLMAAPPATARSAAGGKG
ncbi:YncE family protein [Ramlibacter monticola]|uniref:YncE family protein n=2 Tax=Ramlibacter monticola TaxID=1926872 RepID=A0A936Z3M7_9BURK|nr:YncE family protein [Ramlibacter monticola]